MTPEEIDRLRIIMALNRALFANQMRLGQAQSLVPQRTSQTWQPVPNTQEALDANRKQTDAWILKNLQFAR